MNSGQRKKKALFDKFSANLKHVIKGRNLQEILPRDFPTEAYICPLSLKWYDREGLRDIYSDQLTLEHSPPKALGGSVVALTAKDLNSKSGYSLDINLQRFIANKEFNQGISALKTKVKVNNSISMDISFFKKDPPEVTFSTKTFHQGAQKFVDLMKDQGKIDVKFNIPNPQQIDISLLRIAYLMAFNTFGYALIFNKGGLNPHYHLVRDQLINPERKILPKIIAFQDNFDDELLGVNIITEPLKFRSILAIFDLKTERTNHRYGVFLPAIDAYGFQSFEHFSELKKTGDRLNFQMQPFSNFLNLNRYGDSFALVDYWKRLFYNN